jgi:tetratricopeptide (TPR) repeat protein
VKTILATFLTVLLLFPVLAIGEIQTITHTVKQPFGGSQSPDDARIAAVAKAKREALEMAGTYIESLTVVKNSQVDKDEILALAAGVLKAEVVSQENYHTKDAFGIEVVVKVVVDMSILEERVKKLLQDRTHLTQLKDTQKREKELLQRVAQLEEENRKLTAEKQSTKKLEKQFQQASQGLTAVEWFYKTYALWDGKKMTDPKKAIQYMNEAIRLEPADAAAYNNRGIAYDNLGQYQRAIEDYNEAIRLKPDYAAAYNNRWFAYMNFGQYQRAIEDYNEAIRLKPDHAITYFFRGNAYGNLGQYQRAIEDYNEAIRLKPDYAAAYNNRGIAYYDLGQYQRAIEDYNEAIRLKPDDADVYNNRGFAYKNLGQYQRAIEDYNEAIRLKPDDADVYNNRGFAYLMQGNSCLGCSDYQKACELGECEGYKFIKNKGVCH